MKISISAWHSIASVLLATAGLSSACAGEGAQAGDEATSGELEQAFSTGATSVTASENTAVPFVSAIKFKIGNGATCSGVKIPSLSGSSRVRFLSAGHCIAESAINRQVSITNDVTGTLPPTTFTIPANRTFVHPSFQLGNVGGGNASDNVYDVAFFEVDSGPTFPTTPLSFAFVGDNGVSLSAIGYGKAGSTCQNAGGTKLKVSLSSTSVVGDDRDAHFIHTSGNPTPCDGDSGGPLLQGAGANAKVVGVTSSVGAIGSPPLSSYTRIQGAIEWLNDPVDSTLATIPASLIASGSGLYFMNGALSLNRPQLGCAVEVGKANVSGTDVRIQTCDVLDGTTDGNSPKWALLTSPAGGFKILNLRNGLCLGVNQAPADLVNVAVFTCATSGAALDRQSWTFEQVSGFVGSAYRLKTRASSSFCLSSTGGDNDDVVLASCGASVLDVHKWYLTR